MAPKPVQIQRSQVTVKTVATVTTTALGILGVLYIAFSATFALSMIIAAAVLAVALNHVVDALVRRGLGRKLSITVVMLAVVLLVTGLAMVFIPPAIEQIRALVANVPELIADLQQSRLYDFFNERLDLDIHLERLRQKALGYIEEALDAALKAITGLLAIIAAWVTLFFLIVFMLAFGGGLVRRMLDEATANRRVRYERVLEKAYRAIGGYLGGLFVVVLSNALLTGVFLAILRVPYFLLLGVLAGLSSIIPLVGSTLSGILITLVALATVGFWKAVATAVWFLVYQQFENHVLGPVIYQRAVDLNPLVVIMAVLVVSEVVGIAGTLLAVPALAIAQILLRELLTLRRERLQLPTEGPASPPEPPSPERST